MKKSCQRSNVKGHIVLDVLVCLFLLLCFFPKLIGVTFVLIYAFWPFLLILGIIIYAVWICRS